MCTFPNWRELKEVLLSWCFDGPTFTTDHFRFPKTLTFKTRPRPKGSNEWMNEWMKLFSWQSLHVKDFTMIIDFRKPRLESIWRWLINNGIWLHSKAYAADISKTWNAFSLPERRSTVRSSLLSTRKVIALFNGTIICWA